MLLKDPPRLHLAALAEVGRVPEALVRQELHRRAAPQQHPLLPVLRQHLAMGRGGAKKKKIDKHAENRAKKVIL
jgi:hypothetical protein